MKYLSIFLFLLLCSVGSTAQYIDRPIEPEEDRLILLGAPFYSPETSLGFGVLGVYAFTMNPENPKSKASKVSFGAGYTLLNQFLLYLPFDLNFKGGEYNAYGEVGYYDYTYDFYGIGNDMDLNYVENYGVLYPRIRLNAQKLMLEDFYAGLSYWYEDYDVHSRDKGKLLKEGDITGAAGSRTSGLGATVTLDKRDNIFFPREGVFAQGYFVNHNAFFGSDHAFTRINLEFSTYIQMNRKLIGCFNTYHTWVPGNPPFNMMGTLGGTKYMRGYYEGRYRDQYLSTAQYEIRTLPLFWRIGFAAFAGLGAVAPELSAFEVENLKHSYGGGIRLLLDKSRNINLRLDAGFGSVGNGFYVTVGEAF